MKEKTIYSCEKCGKEFDRHIDCENHEFDCLDKRKLYEQNVKNVVSRIKQDYGSIIKEVNYETKDEGFPCEGDWHTVYKFNINMVLSNGNHVDIYDGMDEDLWLGNYLEEDVIYKSAKREIEKCLSTKYEGVLTWEYVDGWRTDYIGELELNDVVDRLRGRKVKIEVIE